jgi:hypothetical protein
MTAPGRLVALAGLLALVGVSTYGGVRGYKLWHYAEWHARVVRGDSERDVRTKMGSPDLVEASPRWCQEPGTVRAFMYGHSLPPEWWVVGFNESGRVTCTVYLQSP